MKKCRKGLHEFTPENTYIRPDGKRHCIACRKEWEQARERRNYQLKRSLPITEDYDLGLQASRYRLAIEEATALLRVGKNRAALAVLREVQSRMR
jgi:hypothetical protein